jgi:hypothetical protein
MEYRKFPDAASAKEIANKKNRTAIPAMNLVFVFPICRSPLDDDDNEQDLFL